MLLPTIERLLKRSPEVILLSLPSTLSHLKFDLSPFARTRVRQSHWSACFPFSLTNQLFPNLSPQLRAQDDAIRRGAFAAFAALAPKSVSAHEGLLQDIWALLGKGSEVPQNYQRVSLLMCISALALPENEKLSALVLPNL